jgi:Glycosyl hydrolases family 2, sugar binding domain
MVLCGTREHRGLQNAVARFFSEKTAMNPSAEMLLNELNAEHLKLHRAFEEEFWLFKMGDHSVKDAMNDAEKARDAFQADAANLEHVRAVLKDPKTSPKEVERLRIWEDFFKLYQTPPELLPLKAKIGKLESDIDQKLATAKEGYIDPHTNAFVPASKVAMRMMMRTNHDETVRKAVFVVFNKPASETSYATPKTTETKVATIGGPWNVAFQAGRGAPQSITMNELSDWSHSDDPGVRYFSGVGTYKKSVQAPSRWFRKGSRLWIDLGDVKNLAVITVNGKNLGQVWHTPYRLDVTSALRPGENEITIEVVNSWVNRLIGDEQPAATKFTFTDVKPYKATSPLLASGLLGPVTVIREDTE